MAPLRDASHLFPVSTPLTPKSRRLSSQRLLASLSLLWPLIMVQWSFQNVKPSCCFPARNLQGFPSVLEVKLQVCPLSHEALCDWPAPPLEEYHGPASPTFWVSPTGSLEPTQLLPASGLALALPSAGSISFPLSEQTSLLWKASS